MSNLVLLRSALQGFGQDFSSAVCSEVCRVLPKSHQQGDYGFPLCPIHRAMCLALAREEMRCLLVLHASPCTTPLCHETRKSKEGNTAGLDPMPPQAIRHGTKTCALATTRPSVGTSEGSQQRFPNKNHTGRKREKSL